MTDTHTEALVERVARAMRSFPFDSPLQTPGLREERDKLLNYARAAIEALPARNDEREVALVRQKQTFGCTAATLAMVLGCSYEDAAKKLASDPTIFDTQGSGYHVLESQLVQHGFAVARKWRVYQPGNQKRDKWPCDPFADLHWCEVISRGRGHAVVMLRDGTVLDPMSDEPKRLLDYEEVNFVAALVPVARNDERALNLAEALRAQDVDALRYVLNWSATNSRVSTIMKAFTLPERETVRDRLERLYAALADTQPSGETR
jgi:hypothetical protein